MHKDVTILNGDCLSTLRTLDDASVDVCVTSPPYWGLRDYGVDGQLGLETTPDEYVQNMVRVFREVRRVLKDQGTLWLNLGDSYNAGRDGGHAGGGKQGKRQCYAQRSGANAPGLKPKDLVGIPWRVAFALQSDGWYLRQDIIWHKPNPMPESVRDRCTKAHEYIFLLAKSERYHFDHEAIKEKAVYFEKRNGRVGAYQNRAINKLGDGTTPTAVATRDLTTRNRRSVWTVTTKPFKGAHFATFPPDLIEPCILAGCPEGGTVLDPFFGAGTTGVVALKHGRKCVGIELNPEYVEIAHARLSTIQPSLKLG